MAEPGPGPSTQPPGSLELLTGSRVPIGETTTVLRLLPRRTRSSVGPWCFIDVMGPDDVYPARAMSVPPHPHTGLQTVTWLFEGDVLHRDSLGTEQLVRPGQLNLMTAGRGISHSEHSPEPAGPPLTGLQLWVALPPDVETMAPTFAHHGELPTTSVDGAPLTVLMGAYDDVVSPATTYSPMVGAQLTVPAGGRVALALEASFEHALAGVEAAIEVDGSPVPAGSLGVLSAGRAGAIVTAAPGTTVMVYGGEPRTEPLVMWWNFVGSSTTAVEQARARWETQDPVFGVVPGGEQRLAAPPLPPGRLKPRATAVVSYP